MSEKRADNTGLDTKHGMGKNAYYTSVGIFLSSFFGSLTYYFIGRYFGAGAITDAFFAVNVIWLFFLTFASTFRYTLSAMLSADLDHEVFRERLGESLLTVIYITLPLCILLFVFSREAAMLAGIGFNEEQLNIVSLMLKFMVPGLVFMFAGFVFSAALGARGIFSVPAAAIAVVNAVCFLFLVVFRNSFGIYSVIAGMVAGYLISFAIVFVKSVQCRFLPKFRKLTMSDLRVITTPIVTGSAIYMFNEINYWILQSYSSVFEKGTPSIFAYSSTIAAFIIYIISFPISVVSVPSMVRKADEIEKYIKGCLRFNALFTVPVAISFFFMATPAVAFFFGDTFSPRQIEVFSFLVKAYMPVVIIGGVCLQLFSLFFAMNEGKHLFISGAVSVPVNLIVLFLFRDSLGVYTLAAAQLAYTLAIVIYLVAVMRMKGMVIKYIPSSVFPPDVSLYGLISLGIVWYVFRGVEASITGMTTGGFFKISSAWIIYFLLYGIMIRFLSPAKYGELVSIIRKS
ncbi:MAG: oligosaccharide flippase family protein [Candidatus Schekmanbacteria bacterium]|nr:oligosaccharide flippase family protein [Candidatus Schekmanbacteria bacterium]